MDTQSIPSFFFSISQENTFLRHDLATFFFFKSDCMYAYVIMYVVSVIILIFCINQKKTIPDSRNHLHTEAIGRCLRAFLSYQSFKGSLELWAYIACYTRYTANRLQEMNRE